MACLPKGGEQLFPFLIAGRPCVPDLRDAALIPVHASNYPRRYLPALHDVYLISTIAAWAFAVILLFLAWSLISNFMVPVMYRQRCGASKAFGIVVRLLAAYPGEILLYCLFLIVLALATAIVACVATCATCCIAAIPYVGTVILLPVFVLIRAFSLLFLRQFGSDYDVWATLMPPEFLPVLMPLPAASGTEAG